MTPIRAPSRLPWLTAFCVALAMILFEAVTASVAIGLPARAAAHFAIFAAGLAVIALAPRGPASSAVAAGDSGEPGPTSAPHDPSESKAATYKSWWNEHSRSLEKAFTRVTQEGPEEQFQSEGTRIAKAFRALGLCDASSDVLEIGCGVARIGRELAPLVARYTGVDISDNMIGHARQRTAHLANVAFHPLAGVGLAPLESGRFDFVYATIMLLHLDKEDLFEYLKEAHRVLKAGGRAYFDTLNLESGWNLHKWIYDQASHVGDAKLLDRSRNQYATPIELRRYLEALGYEDVEIHGADLVHVLCRKGTSRTPLEADRTRPYIPGHIDSPLENELTLSPDARINGWVYDPTGIDRVQVIVDGNPPREASYGFERPDVGHVLHNSPGALRSGFALEVATLGLSPGWHTIEIVAHRRDGVVLSAGKRAFKLLAAR